MAEISAEQEKMRKASREVREMAVIREIIDSCKTIYLGMISEGEPYVVPLSFGYEMNTESGLPIFYLHSAREGRKLEALKANPKVSFSMSTELVYKSIGIECKNPSYYRSIIGFGTISFVDDYSEKEKALRSLIYHISGNKEPVFAEGEIDHVCVMRLDVSAITGKQNLPKEKSVVSIETIAVASDKPVAVSDKLIAVSDKHVAVSDKPVKITAYTDGSYDSASGRFSYGCVILDGDSELDHFSKVFEDKELATMHNVAGEIEGAKRAMQYCIDNNISELDLYYDYEGIAKWCLGLWKANKQGTIAYRDFYREISKTVKVNFNKVKGHSGNKYNDMADKLAGDALK